MPELSEIFTDPSRRLFWGFLLSSALIAVIAVSWQTKQFNPKQMLVDLCKRDYWSNPSHLVDIFLLVVNGVIKIALLIPLFGSHLLATIWVARFWQDSLGTPQPIEWAWLPIALLYTCVFFLLEDGSRFALHRCMHRFPLLWRLHSVHHSATVLSPLTLHRVHPVEMALYYLRGLIVFGLVSGTFVYLFGSKLTGLDILGVDALGFLFNLLGANLRHSPIWVSFGRLEGWLISPAQHQLHHSSAPEHEDINFGTCLSLWDRLGGSWLPAGPRQSLKFGLSYQTTADIEQGYPSPQMRAEQLPT